MSETFPASTVTEVKEVKEGSGKRNSMLFKLVAIVVIAGVGYGAYYYLHSRWYEKTEDAYANGDIVQVTPLVSGTIVEISAEDNSLVTAGQALVKFDPNDSEVALAQAEATLARTVRQVRGLYANVGGQDADLAAKQVAFSAAKQDMERRRGLETTGAIGKEELAHSQAAVDAAERAISITRAQLAKVSALTDGTSVATHPEVKEAGAAVRRAYLDYTRSTLQAPISGYVTQRHAQLGQRMNPGTPLMSLVPLDRLWVDANFKETQIEHMRVGQTVEVHSDIYGSDVTYHGRIASLGIGTGSAMSLLPAQNATGNWIKIVQRVPVRIALDPKELNERPLRLGMSMHVEVDLHNRAGSAVSRSDPANPAYTMPVYGRQLADAEKRIQAIIHDNSGAVIAAHKPKS